MSFRQRYQFGQDISNDWAWTGDDVTLDLSDGAKNVLLADDDIDAITFLDSINDYLKIDTLNETITSHDLIASLLNVTGDATFDSDLIVGVDTLVVDVGTGLVTMGYDADIVGDLGVAGDTDIAGHTAMGSSASISMDNVLSLSETFDDPDNSKTGLQFTVTGTGTMGSNTIFGAFGNASYGALDANPSGDCVGVGGQTLVQGSGYNIPSVKNVYSNHLLIDFGSGGIVEDAYGFYADGGTKLFGTLDYTNQYGMYIAEQTLGTNTWGIYQAGANDENYLAGNVITGGVLEVSDKAKVTAIGGYAVKLTNKTGANSVAGDVVRASATTTDAVDLTATNELNAIGVFLDSGIADGSEAWVVIAGIADVHMDAGGSALHDRIITSTTAGRGDVNNTPSAADHFREIGHALEAVGANENARCNLHFL